MTGRKRTTTWDALEQRVGKKRAGKDEKVSAGKVTDIMVQRMSTLPSGRLKKYEPLDTRDFVPFTEYFDLTIDNIKSACEKFYNMPEGSCDVLASDRGPSCTRMDQIKGKKFYLVRFIEEKRSVTPVQAVTSRPVHSNPNITNPTPTLSTTKTTKTTKYAASLSVADLLRAGRLVKKEKPTEIELESFDINTMRWIPEKTCSFIIEKNSFARGGFRDAFKATAVADRSTWVIKKYHEKAINNIEVMGITLEEHARKQVQLHSTARNIAQRFAKAAPGEFGQTFSYGKVYFGQIGKVPVTLEGYIAGEFTKYINNDGHCKPLPVEEGSLFEKAQTLVHFSYELSQKKMILVDIQGSRYQLYDPEIATTELTDDDGKLYFCTGNLSEAAINKFISEHNCNAFCRMLNLSILKTDINNDSDSEKNNAKSDMSESNDGK